MKIAITAHINNVDKRYKYATISKNGTCLLWEFEPTLHGGFWALDMKLMCTKGVCKFNGFLEMYNSEFEPVMFELDDEAVT